MLNMKWTQGERQVFEFFPLGMTGQGGVELETDAAGNMVNHLQAVPYFLSQGMDQFVSYRRHRAFGALWPKKYVRFTRGNADLGISP